MAAIDDVLTMIEGVFVPQVNCRLTTAISDEGTPRYRDLDEKAELQATEARAVANIVAPDQISSLSALAVQIVKQAISNVGELIARAERAYELGCYIEAMSLRLQQMELWLRLFQLAKDGGGRLFAADDKRTFGQIIADCERFGFDTELVGLMRAFNLHRTRAIHKFILGAIDYEHLRVICARYSALPVQVGAFTRRTLESDYLIRECRDLLDKTQRVEKLPANSSVHFLIIDE